LRQQADEHGIVCQDVAPYSILFNKHISFSEMLILKNIEESVDIFFNSQKFFYTLKFCVPLFSSAFQFYYDFSAYLKNKAFFQVQHNKMDLYNVFFEFCQENLLEHIDIIKDMLTFDIFSNDNVKTLPYWLNAEPVATRRFYEDSKNIQKYVTSLSEYTSKQIARMCHVQRFSINVSKWIASGFKNIVYEETYMLFNYTERDYRQALGLGHSTFCEVEIQ